jgi:hypothetical protein
MAWHLPVKESVEMLENLSLGKIDKEKIASLSKIDN